MEPQQERPHFLGNKAKSSWRNNKAVLWFVRAGFIFQFYIPMLLCCYVIYISRTYEYTPSPVEFRDGVGYGGFDSLGDMMPAIYKASIRLLVALVILCSIFTLILRLVCHASYVLMCLIGMNVLLVIITLQTMLLLYIVLPIFLYLGAISAECDM